MGTATGVEVQDGPRAEAADEHEREHDIEVIVDAQPAPPQGIGGVTLAEIWGGALRYKPVAAAIVVLLIAAIVLPGAAVLNDDGFSSASSTRAPLVAASGSGGLAGTTGDADASAFDAAGATATTLDGTGPGAAALVGAATSSDFSTFVAPPASSSSSSTATTATPAPSGAPSSQPAATTTATVALAPSYAVREGGWATAQSTSPLSSAGIPEGGLPIGKRLGDVDKVSFVRLAGASTALVLKVSDATGANRFTDSAKVQACRILASSWQAQAGMSLEQAPPYDRNACAAGAVQADGTWRFDLSAFKDAADARGFALVPAADAGTDFQLVFQPS